MPVMFTVRRESAADRRKGSRPTESLLLRCNVMSWAGKLVEVKKT